jgi:hypothetical protein
MKTLTSLLFVALVVMPFSLLAGDAFGLPALGTPRPELRLVDAWERVLDVRIVGSRPLLVIYEDKDSAALNATFKSELSELAKGDRYRTRIVLAAVADVGGYDYWPVRGFVKDAIQGESRKAGTPIYCDWNGAVRRALGVNAGTSSILLYGRDGRVLFASEGAMSGAMRAALIAMLRGEMDR